MQSTLFAAAPAAPPVRIVWENVPGVLSTKDNAFGCFLAGLAGEDVELVPPGKRWSNAGCVYGPARAIAWRTLDAQYFRLAQRRRRVFVVASAGDGFDPSQVLLEWEGVRRDSAPRRTSGQSTAASLAASADHHGYSSPRGDGSDNLIAGTLTGTGAADENHAANGRLVPDVSLCLNAGAMGRIDVESETMIPVAFDTTQITSAANRSSPKPGDPCHPLAAGAHPPAVAFDCKASGLAGFGVGEVSSTLRAMGHADSHQNGGGHLAVSYSTKLHNTRSNQAGKLYEEYTVGLDVNSPPPALVTSMLVRRLTPVECERLQGFPDGYTLIPWHLGYWHPQKHPKEVVEAVTSKCPDGPRYKALGNSMATHVMAWIGRRLNAHIERIAREQEAA
jgi:DNA (cytosine-5)-methyltransferase 1